MDWFSSIVDGAKNQFEGMMQSLNDDEVLSEMKRVQAPNSNALATDVDTSVPHDIYCFIADLLEQPNKGKQLFLSYHNLHKDELAGFKMTRQHITHARSIIQALPTFDKLRFELCPSSMPDKVFWAIYFGLVKDKRSFGAPKDVLEDATPVNKEGAAPVGNGSDPVAGDPVETQARRRDEDPPGSPQVTSIGEDVALVSEMLFSGAKKTLKMAERFIESLDQSMDEASSQQQSSPQASPVPAENPASQPSISPRSLPNKATPTSGEETKGTFEGRQINKSTSAAQDKKRARYSLTSTGERPTGEEPKVEQRAAGQSKTKVCGRELDWSYVGRVSSHGSIVSVQSEIESTRSASSSSFEDIARDLTPEDQDSLSSDDDGYELI